MVVIGEGRVDWITPGAKKAKNSVLLIIRRNTHAGEGTIVRFQEPFAEGTSDHGTAAEGIWPDKTSFKTRLEVADRLPDWALIIMKTSRKVVDVSEKLILEIRMAHQFLEAFRKEFAMLFAGGILVAVPRSEFLA